MPKTAKKTSPKKPDRVIPVIWNIPEDFVSGYATNILVQTGEQEFYVSFFEIQHPVILQPSDAEKLEKVNAECIARVIVTPERLAGFIDALQKQLDAFKAKKASHKSDGSS